MVRVISVHHFTNQDVTSCPVPGATCIAGTHHLLVSTADQRIEVRDLKHAAKVSHAFQTVDHVHKLEYSAIGRYVAALEGKPGEKGATVRVYTNWDDPKVEGAPIAPRIATKVTPNSNSDGPTLDMIEFPVRDAPVAIAACPGTGNLLVASNNVMVIYKYVVQETASRNKYIDFEECIHIFQSFIPREVSLVEDVVGCLSANEVHLFKIKVHDCTDEKRMRSVSLYSFSSESDSSLDPISARRNSNDGESNKVIKNVTAKRQQDSEVNDACAIEGYSGTVRKHPSYIPLTTEKPSSFPSKIKLAAVEEANREYGSIGTPKILEQTLGPTSPPLSHQIAIKFISSCLPSGAMDREYEAECITLVHDRLLKSEEQHEHFKNLHMKPVYWREFRVRRNQTISSPTTPGGVHNPLLSALHSHLMSLTVCFTSLTEGYLYHLPGHLRKAGKGCGIQRIATYPFTSPVNRIALEPTVMHALTETGLETYTLRSGYYTVMEAENLNNKTNASPGGDIPICLVGLRPFLGAKHLLVSGSHLVLLASTEETVASGPMSLPVYPTAKGTPALDDRFKWTIYSLTLPTHIDVHKDMLQLANMNRHISPQGYFQLLCEAHMVLRTSYHKLSWLHALKAVNVNEEISRTRTLYQESCLSLANYYVLSNESKEWKLALPYYRMSGRPVGGIIKKVTELWKSSKDKSFPPGLSHYIMEVVLHPTDNEDVLDASLADLIIDLLGENALDKLAHIVINSDTFRGFKANKMYDYFKAKLNGQPNPDTHEVMAFALLCVDKGVPEEARGPLRSLSNVSLSEVLLERHDFMLEGDSFSEVALLVRDCYPDVFVEVLVSLIKAKIMSLSTILQLFIGSFVSLSGASDATHNAAMLQLFLETYFQETLMDEVAILDEEQQQALQTLIRSYLTSLSVPVRFGEKNIDSDMFGTRHVYLDRLPPFQNGTKEILDSESPEFWCQNSLLKLQSLLCAPICTNDSACSRTVCSFLDRYPTTIGALSLQILCSDPKTAIPLITDQFPEVLLPYAKEQISTEEQWKCLLVTLQDHLSSQPHHELHEAWYSAMQETLDHLAQTMMLDSFLQVVPAQQHNNEEFQGYIQMCRKIQQASQIQALIVSTGNKLLSTLTL